jgi:hypothetical protein
VPAPVPVRALIDTGASCTCVDPDALGMLQLSPTGTAPMATPSTGDGIHQANVFDVGLRLLHPKATLTMPNVAVVESRLANQGIQALIGRDVLANCLLVYDGQAGLFSLAF